MLDGRGIIYTIQFIDLHRDPMVGMPIYILLSGLDVERRA
jgi:hypothetical protein